MKEQNSIKDLYEIKGKVETLGAFQMGAFSIPIGLLWLFLGLNDLFYLLENQFSLFKEKPYNIEISLAHVVIIIAAMAGVILIGLRQYNFYSSKLGAWLPSFRMTKRQGLVFAIVLGILLLCWMVQEMPGTIFPWLGLGFGILYSAEGVMDKPRRKWYYPAIAMPMMGLSFLPFLFGISSADSPWTRIACFVAFGLTLILTGWIDHRNLMRIQPSVVEVADGKTV
jgi:hypothetical protein